MFRTMPDAKPAPVVVSADLIPLSHLSLDVDEPAGGWDVYLSGRGIEVVPDDIGRPAIARADARQLILEKQEGEAPLKLNAAENQGAQRAGRARVATTVATELAAR